MRATRRVVGSRCESDGAGTWTEPCAGTGPGAIEQVADERMSQHGTPSALRGRRQYALAADDDGQAHLPAARWTDLATTWAAWSSRCSPPPACPRPGHGADGPPEADEPYDSRLQGCPDDKPCEQRAANCAEPGGRKSDDEQPALCDHVAPEGAVGQACGEEGLNGGEGRDQREALDLSDESGGLARCHP
jgi:hypothetical protein